MHSELVYTQQVKPKYANNNNYPMMKFKKKTIICWQLRLIINNVVCSFHVCLQSNSHKTP